MIIRLAIGSFALLVLLACGSEDHTPENISDTGTNSLDVSRTNAVKNTPSRTPSGEETTFSSDIPIVKTGEEIIHELPKGVEIPEGMIFVAGGQTAIGSAEGLPREQPVITQEIRGFFMDITPVTVGQYREFVEATGYVTQAEKFGDAAVFDMQAQNWMLEKGAYWEYPRGPKGGKSPDSHPVTQVSYNDVLAYCEWAGKRLPTEAEWEHAARNGSNTRTKYSWGEEIVERGVYKANYWQGHFPLENTGEDGFMFTSPVGTFGESPIGLKDLSGNVWEWCSDWYLPYGNDQENYTPDDKSEKVMRGGSFMCDPNYCWGYRVSGRSGTTPETGLFHVGFRCVKDI